MEESCIVCNSSKDIKLRNQIPICTDCIKLNVEEEKEFEKNKITICPEINEIIEKKLYLGNWDQAKLNDDLKLKFGITHILVCGENLDILYPRDFIYVKLDILDILEQDIKQFFKKAIDFIESSEKVFVHCHAGVSRSASIVIAYVIYKYKQSFKYAYEYVKQKRKCISPNESFKEQLLQFEQEI